MVNENNFLADDTRLTLFQLKDKQNRTTSVKGRNIPWCRCKVHVFDSPSHLLLLSFVLFPHKRLLSTVPLSARCIVDRLNGRKDEFKFQLEYFSSFSQFRSQQKTQCKFPKRQKSSARGVWICPAEIPMHSFFALLSIKCTYRVVTSKYNTFGTVKTSNHRHGNKITIDS